MDHNTKFSSVKKLYPHYNSIRYRDGPISLMVYPTNACNLNCPFCVNSARDKKEKLTIERILEVLHYFPNIKTVEITGGGEPTTWKELPRLVEILHRRNIEIGLVTNGFDLNLLGEKWEYISWVRVSLNGYIDMGQRIDFSAIPRGPTVGVSYVIADGNPEYLPIIRKLMRDCEIDYARLTHDITEMPKEDYYEDLRDGIYIFDRKWEKTLGWCYTGSVKPVLAADGNLYQCCLLCNKGREYMKDQARFDWDISNYSSFGCNMEYCTMNEKNRFIKMALEHHDPHINFV